jgi:small subunit ribosomal protein S6
MPTYETLYIAQPGMEEADAETLGKSFEELVASGEGKLMKSVAWGKRKLAYPVKKHQEGLYFYLQFDAGPDVVAELERRLRNHEEVLKYLSVRLDRIAIEAPEAAEAAPPAAPSGEAPEAEAAAPTEASKEDDK